MSATNKKTDIENWKTGLVQQVRAAQEQLVEENMLNIQKMKAVQKQFTDFSQQVIFKKAPNQGPAAAASNKNESK